MSKPNKLQKLTHLKILSFTLMFKSDFAAVNTARTVSTQELHTYNYCTV